MESLTFYDLLVLLLPFVLLVIGIKKKMPVLTVLAGMMFVVFPFMFGLAWWLLLPLLGLGLYLILTAFGSFGGSVAVVCCALLFGGALGVAPSVGAEEPSQQYNRILASPYYSPSMNASTNYTSNLVIEPKGGLEGVQSAIITLDVWMSPTVTFSLWVNGTSCRNANYTISTTYSGAGRAAPAFDCTNVITRAGNYSVTVRSTSPTGASTVYADITFTSRPRGGLEVFGTEYSPGDRATVFLQLVDSQQLPIENASCVVSVFSPENNGTHALLIDDAPMLLTNSGKGVYYYDLVAPNVTGVYMVVASCGYSYGYQIFYPPDDFVNSPLFRNISGVWSGSSEVLNSRTDSLYMMATSSGGGTHQFNLTYNMSTYGSLNISSLFFYLSGSQSQAGAKLTAAYWNGTAYVNLTNTLTWNGGAGSSAPSQFDQYNSNVVPLSAIINGIVKLRVTSQPTGGTTYTWINWASIAAFNSIGSVQEVKGASELHVTNHLGDLNTTITSLPGYVWNYTPRNLTYYELANFTVNGSSIAAQVWGFLNGTNTTLQLLILAGQQQNLSLNDTILAFCGNITANLTQTIIDESVVEFDANVVILLILIIALVSAVIARISGFLIITAILWVVGGLFFIPAMGFWFGLLIMGVGVTLFIAAFFTRKG